MRLVPLVAALAFLQAACAPDPGTTSLGDAERSWARAFRRAREVDWPYPRIAALRALIEGARPASGQRVLCDVVYDLADTRQAPEGALTVLNACAGALAAGTPGDPLAASMQLAARAGYPPEVMVQAAGLLAAVQAREMDPADLVRVLDRATVFRTPAWTALQFLKDIVASLDTVPLASQVDLFEEALGRKGRHLEAQAVLAAYRAAVRGGFPAGDLSAACRRKLRRGLSPARLPAFLEEAARWPVPPLARADALRLIAAGLAHGLPDEEVASLGGFVARSSMDARDAAVLAARLEAAVRSGLRGQRLLAEALESFSGARPPAPAVR